MRLWKNNSTCASDLASNVFHLHTIEMVATRTFDTACQRMIEDNLVLRPFSSVFVLASRLGWHPAQL